MGPSDEELVQRARAGDRQAFHLLVERHAAGLYSVAALMTSRAMDAQDIVQETLLGAFQGLDRFRGEASVKTWLVRILAKQVARHRRHESYRRMASLDDAAAMDGNPRLAVPAATGASDARLDLADLLGRLPEDQRDVLVLRELEGLSYEEIAQALDIPRGTVESRLFRARQAIRKIAVIRGNRDEHG
ncbi:MAG: sigma-70 family RNA polymerase sigma factor [Phycisphaeraceae bacterium]